MMKFIYRNTLSNKYIIKRKLNLNISFVLMKIFFVVFFIFPRAILINGVLFADLHRTFVLPSFGINQYILLFE